MQQEKNWSSQLIPLSDLFDLHQNLQQNILTRADLSDYKIGIFTNYREIIDSVNFLIDIELISFDAEQYIKTRNSEAVTDISSFREYINKYLLHNHLDLIISLFQDNVTFNPLTSIYSVPLNDIPLRYVRLIFLLSSVDIIEYDTADELILISNTELLGKLKDKKTVSRFSHSISLTQLKGVLTLKEELGKEAELQALAYERQSLIEQGIVKEPQIISDIDAARGYDIASYKNIESEVFDKFIEVKSCADKKLHFYLSENELETSKNLKEDYHLYLYNRSSSKFKVISNPYETLFTQNLDWVIKPAVYDIHKISNDI